MRTSTLLSTLTLVAALAVPGLALADDDHHRGHRHRHGSHCRHEASPPPPPQHVRHDSGRYELRPVSRWVEGHYEQQWVPEECTYKRNGRVKRCRGGYYTQSWVPGRYVEDAQWVWVSAPPPPPHRHYGRRPVGFEVRIGL
jgi:hypothetical protein